MNMMVIDNVLHDPNEYVVDIYSRQFSDVFDGKNLFKGIQPRNNDEFSDYVLSIAGDSFEVAWNFIRMSPLNQEEPNFMHTDDMMGDITAILYLSKQHPENDGTTVYDLDGKIASVVYSKFNRAIMFDSNLPHHRNIFENFGAGESSRLIQVVFLREKK
jgi:hypothetical protein